MKFIKRNFLAFLFCAVLGFSLSTYASTLYERYFSTLARYNAGQPIDDRDYDGEFDGMTTALNRKVLCAGTAPSTPIAGQTWVDTTNKLIKYYRNNEWVSIAPMQVATAAMTTAQAGDLFYNTTAKLVYLYNGTGWNAIDSIFTASASNALNGSQVQLAHYVTGANATGTTIIPYDNTTPQISEGDQYMNLSFTPLNASNELKIDIVWIGANSGGYATTVALFNGTNVDALASAYAYLYPTNAAMVIPLTYYMTAGMATQMNFTVRAGTGTSATVTFNGAAGGQKMNGTSVSSITITEIKR